MSTWLSTLAGRFLVFDGPDGSGKSTQFARFAAACREAGLTVCEVREPGGTDIGDQIRSVLLDPANEAMSVRCEMLLYMASRAQLVDRVIRPALARGELVLADRFISSTLSYQGTAGGIPREEILEVGRIAVGDCWPELVVIFDLDPEHAARRLVGTVRGGARRANDEALEPTLFSDRLERRGTDFQGLVREGYLDQAQRDPERYAVVDASGSEDEVAARLLETLAARLGS